MATTAQILSGYAQPARPFTPTPTSEDDVMDALYGPGSQTAPAPLPPGLPQNVQTYIRTQPSYGEGQVQAPQQWNRVYEADAQDTPAGPAGPPQNPQPNDLQRLFQNRIMQNAPTGDQRAINDQQLRTLMGLPGFAGFTGGDNI